MGTPFSFYQGAWLGALLIFGIPLSAVCNDKRTPIATIDGTPIYESELDRFLKTAGTDRSQFKELPQQFVENYLDYRLVLHAARKEGFDQTADFAERRDQLLYQAYLESYLSAESGKIKISADEIKQFYLANPIIETRQILLKFPEEPSLAIQEKTMKRAEAIYSDLQKGGRDFETVAREKSEDMTRTIGGRMPDSGRFNLASEYYQAALKLKPGEYSQPVLSLFGAHIVQLIEKWPYSKMTPDYRLEIETYLKTESAKKGVAIQLSQLRKKYPVKRVGGKTP